MAACGGISPSSDPNSRAGTSGAVGAEDGLDATGEALIQSLIARSDATPGLAAAVVREGRLVWLRGYGFRDLQACLPVEANTRFYLKSTTKMFLGAAAAILHERGDIELDAPISEYLPDLHLPERINPAQVSLRAHLLHAQPYFDGGSNYRTAFPGNLAEDAFVDHVNRYAVAGDIRFRYSNFGPIMAAHAISRRTGRPWAEILRTEVLRPAGMLDSATDMASAQDGPMAIGYIGGDGADFQSTLTKVDAQMHAAGGMVSTAADLARWLVLIQGNGRIDGEQRLPRRAIEQFQARQIQLQASYRDYQRFAYGLGLYSGEYEGELLLHHFGGETHLSWMPERGIGVVVLSNELSFGDALTHAVASTLYDLMLQREDVSARVERRLAEVAATRQRRQQARVEYLARQRAQITTDEALIPPAELIGHYVSDRLGEIAIARDGDALKVRFGALGGLLSHLRGDGWLAAIGLWGDPDELFVFRDDPELGRVLDWGGRVFVRRNAD
ncbi:MAG: serine hydrolase domain-containing protein [Lysobacterales bacterium]